MGRACGRGDGQGSVRRLAAGRHAFRLAAGLLVACAGVLATERPVAVSERGELPFELARAAFAAAERIEIGERAAAMRPVSQPAERGGRVLSRYAQLKQFSTGRIARSGPRLSGEIAEGDLTMLTAMSGLPADYAVETASLSRFEGSGNPLRDTVDTQMAMIDEDEAVTPVANAPQDGLELAYAPASGPSASSRFNALLKPAPPPVADESSAFVPPIGDDDHAWAATPLPAEAFGSAEQTCLATGIYFEARGESERGQAAVAQVILNRVRNPTYPDTICGVVYQNRHWRNRCQFSFACDGRPDRITNKRAYERAERIAMAVTTGQTWLPDVGSATHYHATYVRPRWARTMEKVEKIGLHVFYRTEHGGWR